MNESSSVDGTKTKLVPFCTAPEPLPDLMAFWKMQADAAKQAWLKNQQYMKKRKRYKVTSGK